MKTTLWQVQVPEILYFSTSKQVPSTVSVLISLRRLHIHLQDSVTVALARFHRLIALMWGIAVENCEPAVIHASQFCVDVVSCMTWVVGDYCVCCVVVSYEWLDLVSKCWRTPSAFVSVVPTCCVLWRIKHIQDGAKNCHRVEKCACMLHHLSKN